MGRNSIAKIIGIPSEEIDVLAAGINHFQWFINIKHKETGEDLYPLLREKNKMYDKNFQPLSRKLFEVFGYYPSCSDDYIGEYLPYGWEAGEEGYDFEWDENRRKVLIEEIENRIIRN